MESFKCTLIVPHLCFESEIWKTLYDFSPTKTKFLSINIVNKPNSRVKTIKHQIGGSWAALYQIRWRMRYLKDNVKTRFLSSYRTYSRKGSYVMLNCWHHHLCDWKATVPIESASSNARPSFNSTNDVTINGYASLKMFKIRSLHHRPWTMFEIIGVYWVQMKK